MENLMAIENKKPDLWTVLKRRRKTVAQFLEEASIYTLPDLKTLAHSLQTVYTVSNKFMTEANGYVLSKIAEDETKKRAEKKVATENNVVKDRDSEETNADGNVDGKEEDRPKKKQRSVRSFSYKPKSSKNNNKTNTLEKNKEKADEDTSS